MKIKKIVLCIIMIFITGCTATYNLNIEDGQLYEQVMLNVDSNTQTLIKQQSEIKQYNYTRNNETKYYKFDKKEQNNSVNLLYNYNYTTSGDYRNSRVLNECFSAFSVINNDEEETISINTSKKFNCLVYNEEQIDSVQINIKTNHKVLHHNADVVKNGIYMWTINSSILDKPIEFTISNEPKDTLLIDTANNIVLILIVASGILTIFGIIYLIIKFKNKQINKI